MSDTQPATVVPHPTRDDFETVGGVLRSVAYGCRALDRLMESGEGVPMALQAVWTMFGPRAVELAAQCDRVAHACEVESQRRAE